MAVALQLVRLLIGSRVLRLAVAKELVAVNANGRRIVAALTFTKFGDAVVDAKTVLPWLLGALSVPAALIGLLVPIRESGSLLPQASLLPIVRARSQRKGLWMVGAVGQALAAFAIAGAAFTMTGTTAGLVILAALAVFALSRSLCSITVKDVMGRTIEKGGRGKVSGTATTVAGVIAITLGFGLRQLGPATATSAFGLLLLGGGAMWLFATIPFGTVDEPLGDHDDSTDASAITDGLSLLRHDAPFRRFVLARTLLLVSALSPPYVIALAQEQVGSGITGVGPFVIASGLAALLGGRLWGGAADRSSRLVIAAAAGSASVIVGVFLLVRTTGLGDQSLFYVVVYFTLAITHTGSRVGRQTYVVDLAEGNRRTDYVAVSNTAMGVLLLVVGGLTSLLAILGPAVALVALAFIGAAGVPMARSLPEVSAGREVAA